jgi:glyoxylase-like metal-dependent hydrolase (beta-lactamase superfamily II)
MTDPRVVRVLAPNPGPFTLDGTNTWVVGQDPSLVIDPGPDDAQHLLGVLDLAGTIGAIVLTHHHPDHAPGAFRLAELSGAPVWSFSPVGREWPLEDGTLVHGGDVTLRVLHCPGHTPDHVVFFDPDGRALFTGDAVLGRGTSVIDPPEGDLSAYLASLERMLALDPQVIHPGHGLTVRPAGPKLREYLEHRRTREDQVLRALQGRARTPAEIVPDIYGDYPTDLHPAAARSVLAHLLKLELEGAVKRVSPDPDRFALVRSQSDHGSPRPPGDAGPSAST